MECDGCTLCCELFPVEWLNKPALTTCKYMCSAGCAIHATKDVECKDFKCAYVQMEKVNVALRPDNCNVIFEKLSNNLFYGTENPNASMSDVAKGQINAFIQQGFSVIIAKPFNKPALYLSPDHNRAEIEEEFKKHLELRYGSTNIPH